MNFLNQKGQGSVESIFSASFLIGFLVVFFSGLLLLFQIIYWNKIAYEILLCHLNSRTANSCSARVIDEMTKPALVRFQASVQGQKIELRNGRPQIRMQLLFLKRFKYEIYKHIDPKVWK